MKVIYKEILGETPDTKITRLDIISPDIASKAKPGQFVVLMVKEEGERIPLTIVDRDKPKGMITLIFQETGFTTKLLGRLDKDDSLYAVVGPLGHPTELKKYGKVILVGGGVGIAELYPVAKGLKEQGNYVVSILGARSKKLLILEQELKAVSDELHITTDDGSYGRKGFTTDLLTELLKKGQYALVYAVGPIPMMRRVASVTGEFKVKTIVSLNALMVDATGMCGCCRVEVAGQTKFSCVDGPEFPAELIDWDGLTKRNAVYLNKEKHICSSPGLATACN
ncbi:sulfide/dihydroorotate dehydrogenase-like FAD/NAD-binding protein [bacterium]|nr:MAG: sulfide/dihydroorotate dehydrogenase-like FAD/NAD-binding protein [bacterium]